MQARNSFVVLTSVRCLTSPEECPRSGRSKRDVLAEGTCSMILTFACHRLTVYISQYRIDIFGNSNFHFRLLSFLFLRQSLIGLQLCIWGGLFKRRLVLILN